ncbi:MAG: acyl-CoA dehydrogenase protein [Frankiales bacterium]|jgi:acyl-CoA dehydrogenase|nr:acyl-CoA dehydrogenase protein [Frankiales bacterium]
MRLAAHALPESTRALRLEVRAFLRGEVERGAFVPAVDTWLGGVDLDLSRALGARGWLGMSYPEQYGGRGASALDRFAVTEELLAAGAPVAAHWIAERQMAPSILKWGTEEQKQRFVPGIARGELYFAIGMSEPDTGSDLASVRTRGEKVDGGWRVNGAKIWTSGAHIAHRMIALLRTSPREDSARHAGLSQFIIDLHSDGVEIRPIISLDGKHHFNEVVFTDVFVPDEDVLGSVGDGWKQCTSELAIERSGPERVLSTVPLLLLWVEAIRAGTLPDDVHARRVLGSLVARLFVLRQMSLAVGGSLASGQSPDVEAALVKDLGTRFESQLTEAVRRVVPDVPDLAGSPLSSMLATAVLHAPGFTLRGGTNEILRGVVARGLGVR